MTASPMEAIGFRKDEYGGGITVLTAANGGAYPYGNSVLIRGTDTTMIVDPSAALGAAPAGVDVVFISHAHEDHLAGLRWFATPVFAHDADIDAVRSTDVLMDGYGLSPQARLDFAHTVERGFGVQSRSDARDVADGHRFDLGGRSVTVVHLPGHTAGHCGLLIEPDGFFFVADIDLTSFGPFYGDIGSTLTGFLDSIEKCASIEARFYGTFHQQGVIAGADDFRERLSLYRNVIETRDQRVLGILAEPHTIAQVAQQRIVYRQHVDEPYVEPVELRTAERHVARLLELGAIVEYGPGRYRTSQ